MVESSSYHAALWRIPVDSIDSAVPSRMWSVINRCGQWNNSFPFVLKIQVPTDKTMLYRILGRKQGLVRGRWSAKSLSIPASILNYERSYGSTTTSLPVPIDSNRSLSCSSSSFHQPIRWERRALNPTNIFPKHVITRPLSSSSFSSPLVASDTDPVLRHENGTDRNEHKEELLAQVSKGIFDQVTTIVQFLEQKGDRKVREQYEFTLSHIHHEMIPLELRKELRKEEDVMAATNDVFGLQRIRDGTLSAGQGSEENVSHGGDADTSFPTMPMTPVQTGQDYVNSFEIPSLSAVDTALALLHALGKDQWYRYDYRWNHAQEPIGDVTTEDVEDSGDSRSDKRGFSTRDEHKMLAREEEFAHVLSLLRGNDNLVTKDLNHILAHLALSSYLPDAEVSGLLSHVFHRMKGGNRKDEAPDISTYAILLLACTWRFEAEKLALEVAEDLATNSLLWTPRLLGTAFHVFTSSSTQREANAGHSKKLYHAMTQHADSNTSMMVPPRAYCSYIAMLFKNDLQDEIPDVVQWLLNTSRSHWNPGLDHTVIFALKLRHYKDKARGMATLSVSNITRIFDSIRANKVYHPSFEVLRELVLCAERRARNHSAYLELVRDTFDFLLSTDHHLVLDHALVAVGLTCAEAFSDSHLAASIISILFTHNRDARGHRLPANELNENLTYGNISRAMKLCANQGDASSILQINEHVLENDDKLPFVTRQMVLRMTLRTFANQGNPDAAIKCLNFMIENNLKPRYANIS